MLEEIGCRAIVLKDTRRAGQACVGTTHHPNTGIGAGGGTDGQVLVMHDMLGINKDSPSYSLRRYADSSTIINHAVAHYVDDVKTSDFPTPGAVLTVPHLTHNKRPPGHGLRMMLCAP